MDIFGIPVQAMMGQLLIGLINGSFYALLSLGLAVIFGLLNIINFAHGAQYMLGAFGAYLLLNKLGLNYWWALLIVPLAVGAMGVVIERTMLARLYKLDHLPAERQQGPRLPDAVSGSDGLAPGSGGEAAPMIATKRR